MGRIFGARRARTGRRIASFGIAAALMAAGACTKPPPKPAVAGLARFTDCASMLRSVQDAAIARVGPYGLGGYSPYIYARGVGMPAFDTAAGPPAPSPGGGASAPPAHSDTNVQEKGVDEPDIVKNDGRRLVTAVDGSLRIVDLTGATARLAGSLALEGGGHQLLLQGDHVLVMATEWSYRDLPVTGLPGGARPAGLAIMPYPNDPKVRLSLVDISNVDGPKVLHSVLVDGTFVDARVVGGRARVVTSAGVPVLPWVMPVDGTEPAQRAAQRANEGVIRRSTATDWLPKVRDASAGAGAGAPVVGCDAVSTPPVFSGFDTVSVLSLDMARDRLDLADTVGIKAHAQTVYSSATNLYVATQATTDVTYSGRLPAPGAPVAPVEVKEPTYESSTSLHAFDVSRAGPATFRASGSVQGSLLNQYSLSEHEGHLRVITTTGNWGCGGCVGDQSQVSVLRQSGNQLTVVGTAAGMGKGEAVKSVRFMGDLAYVVTFRQIDPFYVLDLSDPTKPAIVGELKMPGYSGYLHPVGAGQVLGVGRDATPEGRVLGVKVSLYDVSNPASPTEVRSIVLPDQGWSAVEQNAKAFLWWDPEKLAVVPVVSYGGFADASGVWRPSGFTGAIGINVAAGAITERGRVANEPGQYGGVSEILRSAISGDRLLTVSYNGVRVSDVRTLAPRTWVPFPQPPPVGGGSDGEPKPLPPVARPTAPGGG